MQIRYQRATDHQGHECEGYYMAEKYDGVRAFWDGENFRTTGGNLINVPDELCERMPENHLDGELWMGRGRFDEMDTLRKRKQSHHSEWIEVKYMLIDAPRCPSGWEIRQDYLRGLKYPDWVEPIEWRQLHCRSQLVAFYNGLLGNGAEGVVLAKAQSLYEAGKSKNIVRLKPSTRDKYRIVGYTSHKKNQNLVGALVCEMNDGRTFMVGSGLSFEDRGNPPPLDSYILVNFKGTTKNGVPRHAFWDQCPETPSFLGVAD